MDQLRNRLRRMIPSLMVVAAVVWIVAVVVLIGRSPTVGGR